MQLVEAAHVDEIKGLKERVNVLSSDSESQAEQLRKVCCWN